MGGLRLPATDSLPLHAVLLMRSSMLNQARKAWHCPLRRCGPLTAELVSGAGRCRASSMGVIQVGDRRVTFATNQRSSGAPGKYLPTQPPMAADQESLQ